MRCRVQCRGRTASGTCSLPAQEDSSECSFNNMSRVKGPVVVVAADLIAPRVVLHFPSYVADLASEAQRRWASPDARCCAPWRVRKYLGPRHEAQHAGQC